MNTSKRGRQLLYGFLNEWQFEGNFSESLCKEFENFISSQLHRRSYVRLLYSFLKMEYPLLGDEFIKDFSYQFRHYITHQVRKAV